MTLRVKLCVAIGIIVCSSCASSPNKDLQPGLRARESSLENMRIALREVQPLGSRYDPGLSPAFRALVSAGQPETGNAVVVLASDADEDTRSRARRAIAQLWDALTREQRFAYCDTAMEVRCELRPWYPFGVPAWIGTEYGLYFPASGYEDIVTESRRYVDGVVEGEVYRYKGPMAGTGGVATNGLELGRHTVQCETKYTVTIDGETRTFLKRSSEYSFWIDDSNAFDSLQSEQRNEWDNALRKSISFRRGREDDDFNPYSNLPVDVPCSTVKLDAGKTILFWIPRVKVAAALPFDLCYDVVVKNVETGRSWPASPLYVLKGETGSYSILIDNSHAFAEGREGEIPVRIELTPSRGAALTNLKVTSYYPLPITSEIIHIKIEHQPSNPEVISSSKSAPNW